MPSGKINTVVFDLGGVLIDWDPRYLYRDMFADPEEMEHFLSRICTEDWHREHDLGVDIRDSCERLAREHPDYRDMIMVWADRGEEMAAGQFDRCVEVLSDVKATGMACYALSNMEAECYAVRLERFPFMTWFDGHVISALEGVAKPDRRIFEILLDRYGLEPESTAFVDDSLGNMQAARALGIHALHFQSAARLRQDLRALGLTELAPA
jgi:2-haloacid dehalogenase